MYWKPPFMEEGIQWSANPVGLCFRTAGGPSRCLKHNWPILDTLQQANNSGYISIIHNHTESYIAMHNHVVCVYIYMYIYIWHMEVSWNRGTPKSSSISRWLDGIFYEINQPSIGVPHDELETPVGSGDQDWSGHKAWIAPRSRIMPYRRSHEKNAHL